MAGTEKRRILRKDRAESGIIGPDAEVTADRQSVSSEATGTGGNTTGRNQSAVRKNQSSPGDCREAERTVSPVKDLKGYTSGAGAGRETGSRSRITESCIRRTGSKTKEAAGVNS